MILLQTRCSKLFETVHTSSKLTESEEIHKNRTIQHNSVSWVYQIGGQVSEVENHVSGYIAAKPKSICSQFVVFKNVQCQRDIKICKNIEYHI